MSREAVRKRLVSRDAGRLRGKLLLEGGEKTTLVI